MWIMLNDAFLSIVKKDVRDDELLVRARRLGDIEKVFGRDVVVTRSTDSDYLFRAAIKRDAVVRAIQNEVLRIDYGNFKDSVAETELHDAYLSVAEALRHAGAYHNAKVDIRWVNTEVIEQQGPEELLKDVQGILVPGGFGDRGVLGKVIAAGYAREHKIPYLGLCYGMQMAVIEFARNVLGLPGAFTTEIDPRCTDPVIDIMPDQRDLADMGGTMRLGLYPCNLVPGTKAARAYGEPVVYERHRHRFEFNNAYRERMHEEGLIVSGLSPDGRLVEIIELRDHPWFVASQFHPELKSRPTRPHPLFRDFIKAVKTHSQHPSEIVHSSNGKHVSVSEAEVVSSQARNES